MAPNPDPKRITAELWRFIEECKALEPADTGGLYPYADKPGYHNSRAELLRDGRRNDYSVRLAEDRDGPDWACAAFDWISESARTRGDRRIMNKYGIRIQNAFNRRDPRFRGWREVLTQVDAGRPEGFDVTGWYTRVPDDTHDMHHHFSKLRRYLADWPTYAGMLSILADEPLNVWLAGRSRYRETLKGDEEMPKLARWSGSGAVFVTYVDGTARWVRTPDEVDSLKALWGTGDPIVLGSAAAIGYIRGPIPKEWPTGELMPNDGEGLARA